MVDTKQLVNDLSRQAAPATMARPGVYILRLLAFLVIYSLVMQWLLGFRTDISVQFGRPLFVMELLLLAGLLIASANACVLAMYPDQYQKRYVLRLPYVFAALIACMMGFQFFMLPDPRMMMPTPLSHSIECTQFIAVASLLPAALIFILLKKGATLIPLQAGGLAIMTAWSIGALTLRLAEPIDEIYHLLVWHYIPILGFAIVGALLGRCVLKW